MEKNLKINYFDDIKLFSSALWLNNLYSRWFMNTQHSFSFKSGTRNFVVYTIIINKPLYPFLNYKRKFL